MEWRVWLAMVMLEAVVELHWMASAGESPWSTKVMGKR
jgi:hypothetical protein